MSFLTRIFDLISMEKPRPQFFQSVAFRLEFSHRRRSRRGPTSTLFVVAAVVRLVVGQRSHIRSFPPHLNSLGCCFALAVVGDPSPFSQKLSARVSLPWPALAA